MPTVGARASAGLLAAAVILGGTVGGGLANEHRQLPAAVSQLTGAVVASADALACLQGVQDDLFIDTAGDTSPASVAAARRRLATCPVDGAVARAGGMKVPPPPPLESSAWRRLRAAVVAGQADVRRGALDVRSAQRAMQADLADHHHGADVVLAYRAAYADYVQAGQDQSEAQALLSRLETGARISSASD